MTSFYISLLPPQNYLAEEILLGSILINPSIFANIMPLIKIDSFFLECHQLIYMNCLSLYKQNKLHPIELLYSLSESQNLYKIGGLNKIIELMKQSQVFISSRNLNIYINELVKIINNNYIKRLMIQYGYNIIRLSYIKGFSSHILYNKASHYLNVTVDKIPKNNFQTLDHLIGDLILDLKYNNKYNKEDHYTKSIIDSGFEELDKLTYGLPNGDLIVLAARPSMGKTSLAINIAYNILNTSNNGVCIFSLEMSSKQILNKLISISSKIPNYQLLNSQINHKDWNLIQDVCNKLLNSKLYIHDIPNTSIDYIEYISKLWTQEKQNIGLIIIDYLQLIQIEQSSNFNRSQELSYITRKLKLLAQFLNRPVLILSQLNRSIEMRSNKEPMLSDLRESGCINFNIHLDLQTNYKNSLHITSLNRDKKTFKENISIKQTYNIKSKKSYSSLRRYILNDFFSSIDILTQYIFQCKTQDLKNLLMTHNHKCLLNNMWTSNNKFLDSIKISYLTKISKSHLLIEYKYLKEIKYIKYMHVYDITMYYYSNFLCNKAILHNSIEQDADIVMMLYEKEKLNNNSKENRIIDIILSKNRNGPTGSCQLLFSLKNTYFKSMKNNQMIEK